MRLEEIRQLLQDIVNLSTKASGSVRQVQQTASSGLGFSLLGRVGREPLSLEDMIQAQRAARVRQVYLMRQLQSRVESELRAATEASIRAAESVVTPGGLLGRLRGIPPAEPSRVLYDRVFRSGVRRPLAEEFAPIFTGIDLTGVTRRQTQHTSTVERFFGSIDKAQRSLNEFGLSLERVTRASVDRGVLTVTGETGRGDRVTAVFDRMGRAIDQARGAQDEFLRSLGKAPGMVDRTIERLKKIGLTLSDLKSIDVEAITGTKLFHFQTVDPYTGAVKRATIAVNRWGDVLGDTATRFKGLEDMIARNTLKVFEWSIAVGLVYGAYNKLGESIQMLKEMDLAFASMAASTGRAKEDMSEFFDTVVKVSAETGMSLMETLGVFDDVLRMTNTIRDPLQRIPAAEAFSRTVMTFARLSALQPAEALDVLLGASMQVGDEINRLAVQLNGTADAGDRFANIMNNTSAVLDTMAYISINSGVQLKDLAQTFAITGEAAADFGLKMSEIGAMAALLSRNTPKSGMEIGNTIRRLIVGMQSESAQKVFQRYGISTTRPVVEAGQIVGYQARTFQEVLGQYYDLVKSGMLGQEAIRQISYAWGGGARGAADITVLLENYEELVNLSAEAGDKTKSQGAAARMLAEYNKTLDASLQRLSNSFGRLIETLGTEGGLLNTMTKIVEVLTGLTNSVGDLTSTLGGSTLRILTFTMALAAMQKYGPSLLNFGRNLLPARGERFVMSQVAGVNVPLDVRALPLSTRIGASLAANRSGLVMAGMYSVMAGAAQQDVSAGAMKAGSILGGAVISTLVTGSPMVGAAIGDVISEIIIGEINRAREQEELRATETAALSIEDLNKRYLGYIESLTRSVIGPYTGIPGILGQLKTGFRAQDWEDAMKKTFEIAAQIPDRQQALEYIKNTYSTFLKTVQGGGPAGIGEELSWDEVMSLAGKALDDLKELQERGVLTPSQAAAQRAIETEELKRRLEAAQMIKARADIISTQTARSREMLVSGEIGLSKFRELREGLDDLMQRGPIIFDELSKAGIASIDEFVNNFARIPKEIRDDMMKTVQIIDDLTSQLAKETSEEARASLQKLIDDAQKDLASIWALGMKGLIGAEPFKFPGFTEAVGLTEQQIEEARRQAVEAQRVFAEAMNVPEEEIAKNAEAFYILWSKSLEGVASAADISLKKIEGIEPAIFNLFLRRQQDLLNKRSFNLERLSQIGPEQFPELQQRVRAWESFLYKIPGYSAYAKKETFNLILGEDPTFKQLITTQEALRYAIEELTKVEKKQLEGMWNIPEGATVMVPLTSLYYAPKQQTGATGGFEFAPGPTLEPLADASVTTSQNLLTLADSAGAAANSLATLGAIQYRVTTEAADLDRPPPGAGTMAMIGTIQGEFMQRTERIKALLDQIFAQSDYATYGPAALGYGASAFKGVPPEMLQSSLNDMKMSLSSINSNTSKLAMKANQPIYISTTVTLDGKVLARELNRYQAASLQNAATSTGVTGATVIG